MKGMMNAKIGHGVWAHITETTLHCPLCGEDNLHQQEVSVYQRRKEDGEVFLTTLKDGESKHSILPNGPGRRDALLLHFTCENCPETEHEPVVLEIIQHKGETHVFWDRDRD
jgi:hypothetical protein